jgi:hypothetical protein
LTNATILMKTNDLHSLTHDVYEKKGTWLKPQVEKNGGDIRLRPLLARPRGSSTYEHRARPNTVHLSYGHEIAILIAGEARLGVR